MRLTTLLSLALWTAPSPALAEAPDLPRQALLRFQLEARNRKLVVRSVDDRSPAARAGLRVGDALRTVNGTPYGKPYEGRDLLRRLDGGFKAVLEVDRAGRRQTVRFTPEPKPLEDLDGFDTQFGVVRAPGALLRTYVSTPTPPAPRRPSIFFIQWVSCDTIEASPSSPSFAMLLDVARRANMTLLRVERSSNGDSEGPACHNLDLEGEVAQYQAAFDHLVEHRWVDPDQVVVWASSLGSFLAPFVVQGRRVAGVTVHGGGAVTYLERMITFDRIRLERSTFDPRAIQEEITRRIDFHRQYLLESRDPEEIEASHPDLKGVWDRMLGTGEGTHYGRPYAYHRQAASKNVLSAWLDVAAPVLVQYGVFDQFEGPHGHRLIERMLNRIRPGQATYVRHPNMGHSFNIYPNEYSAHEWDRDTRVSGAPLGAQAVLDWLHAHILRIHHE
ncbi:MAG: alpha/beta fold hydrolase [Myxococcota bacterium]